MTFEGIKLLWSMIQTAFNLIGNTMNDLVVKLDAVQFGLDNGIPYYLANFKYLIGSIPYGYFMTLSYIGAGFILYRIIQIIVKLIGQLFPNLKGKFLIR